MTKHIRDEHRTSNVQHRMANEGKDDETEELIKIFVTSIKTAGRQATALSGVEGLKRNRTRC